MVVDTSALVAIALGESSRQALMHEIEAAPRRIISSVSLLEAGLVLRARWGQMAVALLSRLVEDLGGEIVPFDGVQARLGIAAFGRFGKGMRHRAQLNLGDCAVYALAVSLVSPCSQRAMILRPPI
jgi:ribonuclease VapC